MSENDENHRCVVEATVVSGFEEVAAQEIRDKLSANPNPLYNEYEIFKGHLYFSLDVCSVKNLSQLQTVDNYYVLATEVLSVDFSTDVYDCLKLIRRFPSRVQWQEAFLVWRSVTNKFLDYNADKTEKEIDTFLRDEPDSEWWPHVSQVNPLFEPKSKSNRKKDNKKKIVNDCKTAGHDDIASSSPPVPQPPASRKSSKAKNPNLPTFRVTCHRSKPDGSKHAFTSQDAAKVFGGAINSVFEWNVDMTDFDLEVVLNISNDKVWVAIALNQESLHRRHILHFGPTTLRSTIAMNLLKFSDMRNGDTMCDPMCGGGSIPIEAAYEWPDSHIICGDIHDLAFQRVYDNLVYNNTKIAGKKNSRKPLSVDAFQWDTTRLPLRDETVDVFVTDLPFGKRSGSKTENRVLYPALLNELARVSRRGSGRAVLLTEDKNSFFRAFEANQSLWFKKKHLWINIGGMWGGVFLLQRTDSPWKRPNPSKNSLRQKEKRKRKLTKESAF